MLAIANPLANSEIISVRGPYLIAGSISTYYIRLQKFRQSKSYISLLETFDFVFFAPLPNELHITFPPFTIAEQVF